jgi:L-ascorbate metabolism protein UlaG (beta-lactamase superfamily)
VTAVAAYHMGGRWGISAASDGRALGYVVETPFASIYYSGDTNLFEGFAAVGDRFRPDVLVLNVNGHLVGADAGRAAWASRARVVVPSHWGGYAWWLGSSGERPRGEEELRRLLGGRLRVIEVGESVPLSTLSDSSRTTR